MTRMGLAVAGIAMTAVLTGCGGGGSDDNSFTDQSADQIVASAKSDMGDLTAVKVAGAITTAGKKTTIDLQVGTGGNCTGSIGIGDGTAQILGVDGTTWFKPDEAFWRSNAGASADQVIAAVGDKWVVLPAADDSFDQFCNVDQLLDQLLKSDDDGSTYSKTGTDEVDGKAVVTIDNTDPKSGTSTGYVLVEDPHYLVKIDKTAGSDTGSVTFSAFDEDFDVQAPADDDVVDLSSLTG